MNRSAFLVQRCELMVLLTLEAPHSPCTPSYWIRVAEAASGEPFGAEAMFRGRSSNRPISLPCMAHVLICETEYLLLVQLRVPTGQSLQFWACSIRHLAGGIKIYQWLPFD